MSTTYCIGDDVRAADGPDGAVLLDIGQGRVFALNAVGSLIFARLGRHQSEAQMVRELSQELGVDPAIFGRDLSDFLSSLVAQDLIRPRTD